MNETYVQSPRNFQPSSSTRKFQVVFASPNRYFTENSRWVPLIYQAFKYACVIHSPSIFIFPVVCSELPITRTIFDFPRRFEFLGVDCIFFISLYTLSYKIFRNRIPTFWHLGQFPQIYELLVVDMKLHVENQEFCRNCTALLQIRKSKRSFIIEHRHYALLIYLRKE